MCGLCACAFRSPILAGASHAHTHTAPTDFCRFLRLFASCRAVRGSQCARCACAIVHAVARLLLPLPSYAASSPAIFFFFRCFIFIQQMPRFFVFLRCLISTVMFSNHEPFGSARAWEAWSAHGHRQRARHRQNQQQQQQKLLRLTIRP